MSIVAIFERGRQLDNFNPLKRFSLMKSLALSSDKEKIREAVIGLSLSNYTPYKRRSVSLTF